MDISKLPWDSPEFYPHAYALAGKKLEFIEHQGKRILTINAVGADFQLVRAISAVCWRLISQEKPKSVRTLSDLTDGEFTSDILKVLSELVARNRPYVLRAALVGVKGMRFFAYQTVVAVTKRPLKLFEERSRALDWLVQEDSEA